MFRTLPSLLASTLLATSTLLGQYPGQNPHAALLKGSIDIHIHSGPDVFDRAVDDFELAMLAERAGMRAVVIKSHFAETAARAELMNKLFTNITVFGGVALNRAVGGINPHAVATMAGFSPRYGKFVWFPTLDACLCEGDHGSSAHGHISIFGKDGELLPETLEVLDLIAQHDLVLATGHVNRQEVLPLLRAAKERGVERMILTHALVNPPAVDLEAMREAVELGAYIEFTYLSYLSGPQSHLPFLRANNHVSIKEMVDVIEALGADAIILSTDLGQTGNAAPPDGFKNFIALFANAGVDEGDLRKMIRDNPMDLIGLTE